MATLEITICIGSSCHLKGSRDVIKIFERLIAFHRLEDKVTLKGSFCMGECSKNGVCICVDEERFNVTPSEAESFFNYEIVPRIK
ncbi:(2Fe-2S) ferredoxin domain-containing protein [Caproiciproducens sp. CPB-2]|uniref:(2Fe-2S) ferredoxin domain-containing protein n=1 Tax=unclassified Caproiciproducens TaxID=2643836 RepID=UPI002E2F8496|nr:(2Fe-2S) ferredoxin domain-containing protein [Caproiciproducens sp. CPB-2]